MKSSTFRLGLRNTVKTCNHLSKATHLLKVPKPVLGKKARIESWSFDDCFWKVRLYLEKTATVTSTMISYVYFEMVDMLR